VVAPFWVELPEARTAKGEEKDRRCAFREDQAPRGVQRLVMEALLPAATSECERGGSDATIACGGGGWGESEGREDESAGQVQDV
jgi:hypothetical protein